MSTSFLYGVHAPSHTKCNVHVISLWSPSITYVSGEFHVKVALLGCQHIICLHGDDMSSICVSLGTMENHVSCDVT
jgi:hypothetical protein